MIVVGNIIMAVFIFQLIAISCIKCYPKTERKRDGMKAFLLWGCLTLISGLLGAGVLGVLYGRQSGKLYMADRLIAGLTVMVGTAEAAHLAAVFLSYTFSDAVKLFLSAIAVLAAAALAVRLWLHGVLGRGRVDKTRKARRSGMRGSAAGRSPGWSGAECTPFLMGAALVFALLVIYQIVTITSGDRVCPGGDMTVETVESFLATDGVYQVNPLTGRAYEAGVPQRIRILCLPTLYGILCRVSGVPAAELVRRQAPLFVLLLSYLAYWTLAKTFFAGERDGEKRLLFMALVAVVFCVGDYLYGMDGFGLLRCGYRGVTIRNGVLLPFTVSLMLRHRWKPVILCILAEVCLVWTLYGMGACLFTALGMGAVHLWLKRRGRGFREAGEEA